MKKTIFCLALVSVGLLLAQDETREIWDTGFRQKRPPSAESLTAKPPRQTSYVPIALSTSTPGGSRAGVGLTIWRLRRPVARDGQDARLLVQDVAEPPTEFVAERLRLTDPLQAGERIRLSIEVPRAGFLYVVDRERYVDGSLGDPYLIFPALNIRNGENAVAPGHVVEIPPQNGTIRALRLERHGDRHIGEKLMLIVSEQPIPGMIIGSRETKIPAVVMAELERNGTPATIRLDLVGGSHDTLTLPEKNAGASSNCLLTQEDAMPESIFAVSPRPLKTLLVSVPVDIR